MPLDEIGTVLSAPDVETRTRHITAHLSRLEHELGPGGVFADGLFTEHRGEVTVFVPCDAPVRPVGRVRPLVVPATELAVIEHHGPPSEVDRSYGALAAYVARHALAVDGPMREYYLVGRRESADDSRWRTEVGWPVFGTAAAGP